MPVQANGRAASSTDPETWTDFKSVSASDRIGFVLGGMVGGKHVVCVDLDHCFTADGSLTAGAADFLNGFPATWTEKSPSGDGLHVWGLVDERPKRCVFTHKGQSVEIYVEGRYITITRSTYGKAPLVLADLSGVLKDIV